VSFDLLQGEPLKIEGYWLASGILGVTGSAIFRVIESGADAVVTKSVGLNPRKGYPGPIITTSHGGLLNAVGLTNPGIDSFLDEIGPLKNSKIPIILSIFGNTIEEITRVAKRGMQANPAAIELNLSCPHAKIGLISHSPELTYDYVKAVNETVDCQVFAKITPNASEPVEVAKAAQQAGADAIVAVNTLRGMRIDIDQKRPVLGNNVGGLSGPPLFPVAVRCVYDLYQELSIPIIGVGGVSNWHDAVEMHLAGATAIQIGTALLTGFNVFKDIKQGVNAYLHREGFESVSSIIGLAGRG
jgi:dihydroorotate dehydrogenase (NAD+) catalytic subunit